MAKVVVQRCWPDGDVLTISISLDNSFPDVVAEAKANAIGAYREALEISVLADDTDDDPDVV